MEIVTLSQYFTLIINEVWDVKNEILFVMFERSLLFPKFFAGQIDFGFHCHISAHDLLLKGTEGKAKVRFCVPSLLFLSGPLQVVY